MADVTRDIPPVVYFHEQSPEKLKAEVSEYIITGGFPEGDPRARRLKAGIHEQFVHLLRAIAAELSKDGGPALPASWISGFYGSGKSSFAKLLGLALDDKKLPDGTLLADALLARDDSPRRQELVEAWKTLRAKVDPVAVVFDIGGVARDDEHIHVAALRMVQGRLGYCSKSHLVAAHELKLERDGDWPRFLAAAEKTLGKPWANAKEEQQADDHFSHVLHVLEPERYRDPMSWIDSRAGSRTGAGTAVKEVVDDIEAMLAIRAEGKALFIVVDEVSQYVHQDDNRMLKLQSFVSELGQRLKGAVWLFATGQQKLEDTGQADNIGKLKDRFPPALRVHLHPSNIRDVVHKRLLSKKPAHERMLRDLFQKHRPDLTLHGYRCEDLTEEDFLEVYPMLPGHVDLLMQITSNLRTRSSRVQGDDHAIRGLLQLLGELFREQKLGEREVGELVTLDAIFEVQSSALDADVQTTLTRIFDHPDVRDDAVAQRAAKAVALLELIQEQEPTTPDLVSRCLYRRLGEGNQVQAVSQALERLRAANLVAYSEKHGFKIQSSAGQEWERERDDIGVTAEQVSEVVKGKLKVLLATPERPRHKGCSFPWAAFFSDGRHFSDERVQGTNDNAAVTVDFRFLRSRDDRAAAAWIQKSDQEQLKDRLLWVVGEPGQIEGLAREFARSEHMIKRYGGRRESLTKEKARLLLEEEARFEELEKKVLSAVGDAFLDGKLFFRGQPLEPRTLGSAFAGVLVAAAQRILPALYPFFTEIAVTPTELGQLLEKQLAGPSNKFMESGLGICRSTRASTSPPAPAPSRPASSSSSRRRRGRAAPRSSRTSADRPMDTRSTWSGPASPACSAPERSGSGPTVSPRSPPSTTRARATSSGWIGTSATPTSSLPGRGRSRRATRSPSAISSRTTSTSTSSRTTTPLPTPSTSSSRRAASVCGRWRRSTTASQDARRSRLRSRGWEGPRGLPPLAAGGGDGHCGEEAPRRAVRRARAARHLPQRADRGLDPRRRRRRREPRRPASPSFRQAEVARRPGARRGAARRPARGRAPVAEHRQRRRRGGAAEGALRRGPEEPAQPPQQGGGGCTRPGEGAHRV